MAEKNKVKNVVIHFELKYRLEQFYNVQGKLEMN